MTKFVLYFLLFVTYVIHQITAASLPADHSAVLKKLEEKPRYKEAEQKKNYHRDSALMQDTKSQDAYCKAGKSCMPGGNVFRKIEGRYPKARFQSHTDKALREAKKLTELKKSALDQYDFLTSQS